MATIIKNSRIVGLKELRENTEQYISAVEKGASFTVVRRSRPIFTISPVSDDEGNWEMVIDFTAIDPEGIPAKELLKRMKTMHGQGR
jgi:prevent-host-death family protein